MIEELHQLSPFDPEHLPEEILLTEAFHQRFPNLPQVACFDTAFHHDLPLVARLLPIPRRYEVTGDALAIAQETAKKLDMGANILDAGSLGDSEKQETSAVSDSIENADGFAQVFPEHK